MLGRPGLDAGDDEADVEALCGGLDPGAGEAVSVPGFRPIACLGEAAQAGLLVERAAGANVVRGLIDQPVEHAVAREAKDEVEVVLVAPFHDLRAAVMTVASDRDPGLRPVPADATDETAQVTADLDARGRLAGAQQHGDRPAGGRERHPPCRRCQASLPPAVSCSWRSRDRPSPPSGGSDRARTAHSPSARRSAASTGPGRYP